MIALGAPQRTDGRAGEEPEDHKRFGSHTFVPISWMCKKQTAVSHSSTESEIISLDTGLRLDGLPALELCDLIVSVFGNISHISDRTRKPVNGEEQTPQISQ